MPESKKIIMDPMPSKEEIERNFVNSLTNDPNNLSFWYPQIKNCGILTPRTIVVQNPVEIMKAVYEPGSPKNMEKIIDFVKNTIYPQIPKDMFFLFIKNGTFSNKFNFGESCKCRRNILELISHFINVNYGAACVDAGGASETVIREYIGTWQYIDSHIPCIYNGMPLRPEFRVFYDFDQKKVLYTVNYWDWDYCNTDIGRNATDGIIFASRRKYLDYEFEKRKSEVESLVSEHLNTSSLLGQWSADILWDEESQEYWLIDMATAETSAYWDSRKIKS